MLELKYGDDMKRLLFLIYIFSLFCAVDVYAQDKTTFTVSSVGAKAGDEVTISVNMKDNPNFQSLSLLIPLNSIYVEYESCEIIGFKKATMKDCGINPKNEVTFYAIQVSENDTKLFSDTGDILNVTLKIKDNVKEDIPITLDVKSYAQKVGEKLEYNVVNGMIKTTGELEEKVINSNEDLSDKVDEDVTWSSSNDDVAKVDSDGKVTFNESGNTTITAKNKNGKTVYEKTYVVNNKEKKNISKYLIIGIISIISITIIIIVMIFTIKFIKRTKKK